MLEYKVLRLFASFLESCCKCFSLKRRSFVSLVLVGLCVNDVVRLDVAVARQFDPIVSFCVVAITGFVLAVIKGLLVVVLGFDNPVELVVRVML